MNKLKTIGLWIATSLLIFLALGSFFSFATIAAALAAALIIPIPNWQTLIKKYIKGKIKTIAAIILAILACFTLPTVESDNETILPTESTSIVTTSDTTVETEPSEVSTTAPTTEPTAALTTEPTAAPTTEPTAAPTTEPTAAPTTKPVPPPTTVPAHVHSFGTATCTMPKTCACGATEGSAAGHTWQNATCTAPKTCTVCKTTEGSTLGHNYANGNCVSCGSSDPNYVNDPMVWIPTNGGQRYHSKSSCSNMIEPIQVSKSSAESQGFTPCGRCY